MLIKKDLFTDMKKIKDGGFLDAKFAEMLLMKHLPLKFDIRGA